jgi:molybdopterin converting factor small subunit
VKGVPREKVEKVRLEFLPSLAETLGIEQKWEEVIYEQGRNSITSVIDLLNRLAVRYPRFGELVFDVSTQKLTGKVSIFINNRHLELVSGLETKLKEGDILTFVPPVEGG